MFYAAIVLTTQMINECFGVSVTSGGKDGAAPELNPGWVHRRINTCPEVRHAQNVFVSSSKKVKYSERCMYVVPCSHRFSLNGSS